MYIYFNLKLKKGRTKCAYNLNIESTKTLNEEMWIIKDLRFSNYRVTSYTWLSCTGDLFSVRFCIIALLFTRYQNNTAMLYGCTCLAVYTLLTIVSGLVVQSSGTGIFNNGS